ncbi:MULTISPECIES: hypothetical protein [unclassified Hydrogenobaculum]|nr:MULTISPECIES: hypothetical protein [unclassified Hydrogenobaculum]AEF18992.1 hypothetical protein Hyd3684_0593 [Hydrogenobaculum sp. 3684]AEG46279.1 hypothetical protein HydSHO_0593 [Hydrogenobaculum sp. SHO]AGG14924.1 hypothetical protein HydHO_0594 [Hydrogenobaculum sp. HO]AGH93220.1 hypothetical protein HydSN_0605 [Hydrogenobaculum sp. SN]
MIQNLSGNSKLFLINIVWAFLLFFGIIGFVFIKSLKKENVEKKDEFD